MDASGKQQVLRYSSVTGGPDNFRLRFPPLLGPRNPELPARSRGAGVINNSDIWKETVLHNAVAWRSEGTSYIKFQVDKGGNVNIKGIILLRPVDMILEDM